MFIIIAAITCIIPIAGFILTLIYFNQYKQSLLSALLCGISFSAAFYGYTADQGNDIYRHMDHLILYENLPIYNCFDVLQKYNMSHIYTWDIWSWIISQTGNFYLLQSSAALVGYSILSYIVFDYAKHNNLNIKQWITVLLILLTIISPLNMIIGIRISNAFVICALAFYRYYDKNATKLSTVILLGIAFFLHHGVITIIVSWLILPFFRRYRFWTIVLLIILMITFDNYPRYLDAFGGDNSIVSEIAANTMYSAVIYQNGEFNSSLHAVVSIAWHLSFTVLLFISARAILLREKGNQYFLCREKILDLSLLILFFSIILIYLIGNNGSRYLSMSCILSWMILLISRPNREPITIKLFDNLIVIGSIGNVILFLYEMNWGTGSLYSFFTSALLGYISKIAINI